MLLINNVHCYYLSVITFVSVIHTTCHNNMTVMQHCFIYLYSCIHKYILA